MNAVAAAEGLPTTWEDQANLGHVLVPGEVDLSHNVILYLEGITVSFDGFKALNKLSLAIDAGELRCIIGPNGAGKTTMMDVITGKTRPDAGKAFFGQTMNLRLMTEPEIAHAGIGRKFQKPTIFENHTVFENLELAMKTDKRVRRSLFSVIDTETRDKIAETLRVIESALAELPEAQRQVVVLRDVEGLSSEEICNILEVSDTTQRVLLHRGRARVRQALDRYVKDGTLSVPPARAGRR